MTGVAKIVELVGSSEKGWSEAAQAALDEAKKTIKGITGWRLLIKLQRLTPASGKSPNTE
jgi:dodecin